MPELPEVEIVKRSLSKITKKAKILDIKIKNKNLRYKVPKRIRKELVNEKIIKISRRSKYLIFHFKDKNLLVHLGMTGKIIIMKNKSKQLYKTSFYYNLNILPQHNHIYFVLNNGFNLIYNDVRRFGFFRFYKKTKLKDINFLKKLGIEPLSKDFNAKYFRINLKKRKKNIKNLLMDQTFISGLGNIYVNEVLFNSKIHPLRSCKKLNKNEIVSLILNIKKILKISILTGGSSIKDFKDASGKSGSFQQFFKVYGRQNKKCSRISCNSKVKKFFISGRSSFYCENCQI